jgi:hypothetical protein
VAAAAPRLRALASAVDPTLRLYEVRPLGDVNQAEQQFLTFWFRILLGVCAVALTLSLAGIYAVMSFTVARRTREIGIRVALGAAPWRVVLSVLRRPVAQVAAGIGVGATLVGSLLFAGSGTLSSARWPASPSTRPRCWPSACSPASSPRAACCASSRRRRCARQLASTVAHVVLCFSGWPQRAPPAPTPFDVDTPEEPR